MCLFDYDGIGRIIGDREIEIQYFTLIWSRQYWRLGECDFEMS